MLTKTKKDYTLYIFNVIVLSFATELSAKTTTKREGAMDLVLNGMQVKTFRGENLKLRVKQWLEENPHIQEVGTDPFPTHDGEPAVAVFYNLKS